MWPSKSFSENTIRSTAVKQPSRWPAASAFREMFNQARPALLEPIVHMEITTPEDSCRRYLQRHEQPRWSSVWEATPSAAVCNSIHCEVPLRDRLATTAGRFRASRQGQGSYTLNFSHYETVPGRRPDGRLMEGAAKRSGRRGHGNLANQDQFALAVLDNVLAKSIDHRPCPLAISILTGKKRAGRFETNVFGKHVFACGN